MKSLSLKRRQPLRAACAAVRLSPVFIESCERRLLMAIVTDPQLNPLTAVPQLHSLPSAPTKLYLDFNGAPAIADWLGTAVPATPAYDRDDDPLTFTSQELTNIREVWERVAESYSPFNVDVTTVEPPNFDNFSAVHCIIGGSFEWLGAPAGGVAPLGALSNDAPNICFVFTVDGVDTPKSIADATAHELGHTLGLNHQSLWDDQQLIAEYDEGTPEWAPIMGVSYYSARGLWRTGPTPNVDAMNDPIIQDDLAVITSQNGFGYRVDDYGNTRGTAKTLTGVNGTVSAKGIITTVNDDDYFRFDIPAGRLSITVSPFAPGGMLDATLELQDASGTILQLSNTDSLSEGANMVLAAGTYYAHVYSHGQDDGPTGGNEGDIGQYELRAALPTGVVTNEGPALQVAGTDFHDKISVTFENNSYKLDINGKVETIDPTTVGQFNILAGEGDDAVTIGPGVCKVYVLGGAGSDTIIGGDFNDTITGSGGNDLIFGNGGDDRLAGSPGSDQLFGGDGRDRLYGDDGNDGLRGGANVDRIYGGLGHDILVGDSSNDKLFGEDGNDSMYGGTGDDPLNGGVGLDYATGGDGDDFMYFRDTAFDSVVGGNGFDAAQTEKFDFQDSLEELLA